MRSSKSKTKLKPKVDAPTVYSFEAIGTQWTIEIFETFEPCQAEALLATIKRRIVRFDQHYSRFRPDSLVSWIAQGPGTYRLPPDGRVLFDLYKKLYAITEGKVTPLIGNLLHDAGYDAKYSLQQKERLREVPKWGAVLKYDFPMLTTTEPVILDFGAVGKGYLVDIIGALLRARGIKHFSVNAGGDILVCGSQDKPLAVGLEHPDDTSLAIGVAMLAKGSLCGSAGNRRTWSGFTHIMDPGEQSSPTHIKALWVYAENAMLADALSTCLFFVSPQELGRHFTFEYAIVKQDNSLVYSKDFPADFFETEN
ncbi:MAG TPA: FAD:protein FMN transferase [Candidatus Saccharimonadales bacterium]|nr:FAD:protein FMN transferase [Candidatus Saccharimonadales bacterium]